MSFQVNFKKHTMITVSAAVLMTLGACAGFGTVPINVGDSESDIVAKLGSPTHRYQDGKDRLLEYMHGPWGQTTYMARIGADNKLVSYEQVLTVQKFATIKPGQATKENVLRAIGAPSETSYFSRTDLEVWSYPYKENGVWDSVMHVHFDKNGIVRTMQNGPDLRFDPDARWPFAMMRM